MTSATTASSKRLTALIQSNADLLQRLRQRIDDTFALRHISAAHREAWSVACGIFHRSYPDLAFPGGWQRWAAFVAKDAAELPAAIAFLEVDPLFFRSGYLKKIIWTRLKSASLTNQQRQQIEQVALGALQVQVRREFWDMARYLRLHGSPSFWLAMESLAAEDPGAPGLKAHWLLLTKQNLPVQRWLDDEFRRSRYRENYTPKLRFSDAPDR